MGDTVTAPDRRRGPDDLPASDLHVPGPEPGAHTTARRVVPSSVDVAPALPGAGRARPSRRGRARPALPGSGWRGYSASPADREGSLVTAGLVEVGMITVEVVAEDVVVVRLERGKVNALDVEVLDAFTATLGDLDAACVPSS